jgi:SNF2 family DNA or RNA helicase
MTLFPYQQAGADFLADRTKALLADGMGLGKTAQAIVAANKIGAQTVVVICPAIARINWRREFDMWGAGQELYVESYDTIVRRKDARQRVQDMQPDVLILDEAHYLKSRTSKRTQSIYGRYCIGGGLSDTAGRVWLLTGTPAPNDVSELYPHLSGLWPDLLPSDKKFHSFITRYCHVDATPFGIKVIGNKKDTLPELRSNLQSVMLRRRAEDVLKDLPPIVWQEVEIEPDEISPELAALEGSEELKALRAVMDDETIEMADVEGVAMATLRRMTGAAKANVIGGMLADELGANAYDKVIVFAHHKEVIKSLRALLEDFDPVVINGETTNARRQEAIDRFQTDPSCRVFIGQIQACATAVTLHAASQVVFAEASWTPSDNAQAAKRAHRIGQTRPVMVRMIGLAGSIDAAVTRVLARKSRQISEALGE